jgi:hypothetical protein
MTTVPLSTATQGLIRTAIDHGPGTNNQNYVAWRTAVFWRREGGADMMLAGHMRRVWLCAGLLLAAAVLLALGPLGAGEAAESTQGRLSPAGEAAARAEWEKVRRALAPHPSTDTTPVEFSVGGIHYRMPRNYLLTMDNWAGGPQSMVTIRVNLPDLKPLAAENRACFTGAPADQPAGCLPLSFIIDSPGGPSAQQAFERSRTLFHSQTPIKTSFGLDKYEVGPADARIEFYKSAGGASPLYRCLISDNRGKRAAVCDEIGDRVKGGPVIHFFFDLEQLPTIDQENSRLRELVEHFIAESGGGR